MTGLVREKLERAGLLPVVEARADRRVPSAPGLWDELMRVDLLSLGAAADLARRAECGDDVRIYLPAAPARNDLRVFGKGEPARGSSFLRKIAALRLTSPIGVRFAVDFGVLGLEVAQIALSFGATDLAGPIASRRGLLLVDTDEPKKMVKRAEIAGFVERAGYRPVFVAVGAEETSGHDEGENHGAAVREHVES
jgi:hypothetical protein